MEEFKPKLDKRWNISKELELIELWEKEGIYKFDENKNAPVFSIDTPPPYASGPWHIGGVVHYSQIDMIARYKRMKGYNVLFPMGIDRNGLPIEVEA
ncbi:MAG: class I tRNA ligase family protein, partial [Nitrososphaerota archaeon]